MKRSTIATAALVCAVALAGCAGSDESAPAPAAAQPTATQATTSAPSPAATATPKHPTDRENIRATLTESFPALLTVTDDGYCLPSTPDGALQVAYTARDGAQVLLGVDSRRPLDSDMTCELSSTTERPALDPEHGAHLVQASPEGYRKLAPAEVNEVIGGWSLRVDVTDELLTSLGVPTETRASQVNLVNAVREAGYAPTFDPTPKSIVQWAQAECAEWSELAADADPDALLAHLIRYGKPTGDLLAAQHMCPEHLDVVELAQRSFEGGLQVAVHDPDPSEREIYPGTYRTVGDRVVRDCYWERTTGSGDIIANDFITAAVDGLRVTVNPGETFLSRECGPWAPVQ